ncbi:MAG: hypothetical protein JNJ45_10335 [Chthonomonas sp.]|nr:hypothetical protein [Chthonomonas sp.]
MTNAGSGIRLDGEDTFRISGVSPVLEIAETAKILVPYSRRLAGSGNRRDGEDTFRTSGVSPVLEIAETAKILAPYFRRLAPFPARPLIWR